jgi:hypothetical protein
MKYLILIAALLATVACSDKQTDATSDVADTTDVASLPLDATAVDASDVASDVAVDVTVAVDASADVTLADDVTVSADAAD